jgi:ABC-2 type transport system permease protein
LDLLKGFGNFLLKELKELIRDPKIFLGMIIVPAIMFPLLGSIMSYSVQSAQEKAQKATLLVLNNDGKNWSETFINNLTSVGVKVSVINNTSPEDVIAHNLLAEYNATQFIEIPSGFSDNLTQRVEGNLSARGVIKSYVVFSGSGMFETIGSSVIDELVNEFNRVLAPDVVESEKSSIIKGQIAEGIDPSTLSGLMISQAIAMPITIMILLTYSMQIAATSVAMEKEEKTLETVLTLPMDRFSILMGKLSGSIIVAGVGALAYMIGFNYYMGSFSTAFPAAKNIDLVSLGLVPSLFGYFLLGISLFVTLLSALALAVIISAFAEDVRSAQSVVGYIYPLIFIPSLALMYLDINTVPLAFRIILYAIPFSQPVIASKAIIMGDYVTAGLGIAYVTVFTLVVMYVASRLFATEKILTAKLRFRGLRLGKRGKEAGEEMQ